MFPVNAVITTEYLVKISKSLISMVLFSSFDLMMEILNSSLSTYKEKQLVVKEASLELQLKAE